MSSVTGSSPGRGKRKAGAITFWVGIVLGIGSLALAIITGLSTFNTITDAISDAQPINGNTSITLQAGDERTIYQVEQGAQQAACQVTGPDGQELTLSRGAEITGSSGDTTYVNVGNFTAEESGEHQIACEGPRTLVGPAVDVGSAVGGVFGILAGIGGVLLGGLLAIIGAIIWFIGRGEGKRAATAAQGYGYGPPSYGQGGYQQGGYQQGGGGAGGYQQGGYQQGGGGAGGYQQGGYQQGGDGTGGYQQGDYEQGGYQQGGDGHGDRPPPPPPTQQ